MFEGDMIYFVVGWLNAAFGGKWLEFVDVFNLCLLFYICVVEFGGVMLEEVEVFGKHLVVYFSNGFALHSYLGMNGCWFVVVDGWFFYGRLWL